MTRHWHWRRVCLGIPVLLIAWLGVLITNIPFAVVCAVSAFGRALWTSTSVVFPISLVQRFIRWLDSYGNQRRL